MKITDTEIELTLLSAKQDIIRQKNPVYEFEGYELNIVGKHVTMNVFYRMDNGDDLSVFSVAMA